MTTGPHARNWDAVRGVGVHSTPGIGVGGLALIEFRPIAFLRDGRGHEIDDAPLEDIDLTADPGLHPRNWGRWREAARGFPLTDDKGRQDLVRLQDRNFFCRCPSGAGRGMDGRRGRARRADATAGPGRSASSPPIAARTGC